LNTLPAYSRKRPFPSVRSTALVHRLAASSSSCLASSCSMPRASLTSPEGPGKPKPSHIPSHTQGSRTQDTSHSRGSWLLQPESSKQPVDGSNPSGGVSGRALSALLQQTSVRSHKRCLRGGGGPFHGARLRCAAITLPSAGISFSRCADALDSPTGEPRGRRRSPAPSRSAQTAHRCSTAEGDRGGGNTASCSLWIG